MRYLWEREREREQLRWTNNICPKTYNYRCNSMVQSGITSQGLPWIFLYGSERAVQLEKIMKIITEKHNVIIWDIKSYRYYTNLLPLLRYLFLFPFLRAVSSVQGKQHNEGVKSWPSTQSYLVQVVSPLGSAKLPTFWNPVIV